VISHAVETGLTHEALSTSQKREAIEMNFGDVFKIRSVASCPCRKEVDFIFDGNEIRRLNQNPQTKSE